MNSFKFASAVVLSAILISPVFANDDNDDDIKKGCTDSAITAAALVGADNNTTTCIKKRNSVEVVVAMNNNLFNGNIYKNSGFIDKVSQQAVNVRNLARDYENNYDMEYGDEFEVVVVAYASGVDWLKKTSQQVNQNFVSDNLLARGIKIYACQNTMKAKGLQLSDLIDGVETVPAGVTAVVDFQNQGMTYLVP